MKQNISMKTQKKSERNFTLIELLIVVAIIAILAGMLLPALKSALEKGRSVSCMANLKQFSTCEGMYQGTFSDYITPPFDNNQTYAPHLHTSHYHWDYYFGKIYLNLKVSNSGWPIPNTWKTFQCPTDTRKIQDRSPLSYVMPYQYADIQDTHVGLRSNRIKIPSNCIFIAESNSMKFRPTVTADTREINASCGTCGTNAYVYAANSREFGWNHGLKTNILMFDGHGAAIPVRQEKTYLHCTDEVELYYSKVQ